MRLLTSATFIVLLAGDFGLDRIGIPYPLPVPERTVTAIALLVLSLPKSHLTRVSPTVLTLFALLATLGTSILWAPPSPHGGIAAIDAMTAGCLLLAFFYQCRTDPFTAVGTLAVAILVAGLVYAAVGLWNPSESTRLSVFGGGPNVYARVTGTAVLASFYLYARDRLTRYLLFVPPLLVATFLSGSRGGMIALTVAMFVSSGWLLRILSRRLGLAMLVLVVSGTAASVFFRAQVESMFAERILKLTLEERYSSGRDGLIPSALSLFRQEPLFGWGIEGWKGTVGRSYTLDYPHNLPAQLAAELGIVGLSLLALAGIFYLSEWRRTRTDWADISYFSFSGSLLMFTASQVSGDYYDSRMLWVYMAIPGALLLAARYVRGSTAPPAQRVDAEGSAVGTTRISSVQC